MEPREEERNGWSDIPRELLEEVLRKLTFADYLKCGRVCRSWRRTVKDAVATKGACLPAPQFPFLMCLPPNGEVTKPATLFDITRKDTTYSTPIQPRKPYFGFDLVFSVQGWLVFQRIYYNRNYDLILFSNPVSGEEFELPHLPLFPGQNLTLHPVSVKLVFSSAPPNSSDFLVVACATDGLRPQQLAFCKVANKSWTIIPTDRYSSVYFDQFVVHDWKLYAMHTFFSGSVTLFDLKDPNIIESENLVLEATRREYHYVFMLARDGDEILLVANHRWGQRFPDIRFHVFKLDIYGRRWIEVDDLGDRVLLIDCAGIQVISVKDINIPGEGSGGNCVFSCMRESELGGDPYVKRGFRRRDLQVFTLQDKRITHFPIDGSSGRCLWFMPSLW